MRCTNKIFSKVLSVFVILIMTILCGCGNHVYSIPYSIDDGVSNYQVIKTQKTSYLEPFASDLCISICDISGGDAIDATRFEAGLLCDVNNNEVLFSQNAHEKLYPASLTKVLTALVAIKYGSMDQVLTAGESVKINEKGAQLLGLKVGDSMTLAQALHILLLYSANDVAMMIADNVGGNVDHFIEMMNEEAKIIGATNSHFSNPHGLTKEDHYTTAYDLYLIFNEAVKYEIFREIIHMNSYQTVYKDKDGNDRDFSSNTTNLYLRGDIKMPDRATVVGGKTGTTNAAGHCLILLSRDTSGNPYISVILRAQTRDDLYNEMSDLLNEIGN